jgi:hypothetical protein
MKIGRIESRASERVQVLAIVAGAAVVLALLWFFLLIPQNLRRRNLETQIRNAEAQLAQKDYLQGEEVLGARRSEETEQYSRLRDEWKETVSRLVSLAPAEEGGVGGRIDFKVALFDVRNRLMRKAREVGVILPGNLGIDESVTSSEDARELMFRLRTVERLVDAFLDARTGYLREIQPLPARRYSLAGGKEPFLEEFPVRIEFYGTIENLFVLLDAVHQSGRTFVMRQAAIESLARGGSANMLRVTMVMSAFVPLKDPESIPVPGPAPARRTGPMGA